MTYDFATYSPAIVGAPLFVRQTWYQREGGMSETVITHTARLAGKTLLKGGKPENWVASPKAKRGRIPGPLYVQKINASGLIEFGPRVVVGKGRVEVIQEPILKTGAKAGDSWEWVQQNSKHVYTLERFDKWRGRPSAVVNEVIVSQLQPDQKQEVRRVFVQNLGEVERQDWLRISSTERKLFAEKKILLPEDIPVTTAKPEGGKEKTTEGFVGPPKPNSD